VINTVNVFCCQMEFCGILRPPSSLLLAVALGVSHEIRSINVR